MRYELIDYEWTAIKPFLPNKPRGVPRVKFRSSKDSQRDGMTSTGCKLRPS